MVYLTHCSRVVHIYVSKIIAIGSDNGISPGRRKTITWANAGILCIGTLGMKFRTILIEINIISFQNLLLKTLSAKWCPFRLGLNVLTTTATSRCISIWYIKTLVYSGILLSWRRGQSHKTHILPYITGTYLSKYGKYSYLRPWWSLWKQLYCQFQKKSLCYLITLSIGSKLCYSIYDNGDFFMSTFVLEKCDGMCNDHGTVLLLAR